MPQKWLMSDTACECEYVGISQLIVLPGMKVKGDQTLLLARCSCDIGTISK